MCVSTPVRYLLLHGVNQADLSGNQRLVLIFFFFLGGRVVVNHRTFLPFTIHLHLHRTHRATGGGGLVVRPRLTRRHPRAHRRQRSTLSDLIRLPYTTPVEYIHLRFSPLIFSGHQIKEN